VNSVKVAAATAVLVALVGANASFAISRRKSRLLNTFSSFVTAPLILPGLFLGVALLSFFTEIGMQTSLTTVIIGHALVTLPFVVLIVNARLMNLDQSIAEAARDLGATPFQAYRKIIFPLVRPSIAEASRDLGATAWQSFRKITFPLVRPALIGSILIAVAWSFDEFIITFFTIGGQSTLPILIWGLLRQGIDPSVNAIATIILGTTIVATLLAGWLISGRELAR
jgi:ABC-type spermidine/putrescine transport system permease subunit II